MPFDTTKVNQLVHVELQDFDDAGNVNAATVKMAH